ncbi:MAG: HD domain-containing protein [Victivallaceae bacterium]|nr:HD domain-containing protein [Victivallaceae bacterium]
MDTDGIKNWAIDYIGRGLDSDRFCYHGLGHTRNVACDVACFGAESGCGEPEKQLLAAAAWLHDAGFVTSGQVAHEVESARIAAEVLPGFGATAAEIDQVTKLILATDLASRPAGRLEEIMRDADIGHTGTDRFGQEAALLRREIAVGGKSFTDLEWYRFELAFLEAHPFFTEAARRLRGEKRLANAEKLKSLIALGLK